MAKPAPRPKYTICSPGKKAGTFKTHDQYETVELARKDMKPGQCIYLLTFGEVPEFIEGTPIPKKAGALH